jgi:hypothetical protein
VIVPPEAERLEGPNLVQLTVEPGRVLDEPGLGVSMLEIMSSQRVAKWKRWMDGPIKASVITMNHHRQIWRGLAEIIEAHGSLPPSAYWEHYFDVYAETQAMAVRRQADTHPDVASLGRLLAEVSDDVKNLTPEWWIGLWAIKEGDDLERAFARRQWDDEFGGSVGDHLDPAIPATDLARLTEGSEAVKRHVDKHIAHSEDPGPEPKDPGETDPEGAQDTGEAPNVRERAPTDARKAA